LPIHSQIMRKINVLIVDDEKDNSDLLKHFLTQYCPACKQAQGHLEIRYKKWKSWGFPVVYIALDSSKKNLAENFGTPQWPVYCDEKSWDSPWVIAADIQATPTLLLLDQNLKKEYEAENVAQMDLWLLRKNFP